MPHLSTQPELTSLTSPQNHPLTPDTNSATVSAQNKKPLGANQGADSARENGSEVPATLAESEIIANAKIYTKLENDEMSQELTAQESPTPYRTDDNLNFVYCTVPWRLVDLYATNHEMMAFITYAFRYCQRRPTTVTIGKKTIVLEPYEFIFGRDSWSEKLALSPAKLQRFLCKLVISKSISKVISKSISKFTVYRWSTESFCKNTDQQIDQQIDQKIDHSIRYTEKQKDKKSQRRSKTRDPVATEDGTRLAGELLASIRKIKPNFRQPKTFTSWAIQLSRCLTQSPDMARRLSDAIAWLPTQPPQYAIVVLSAATLIEKLDRLELKMQSNPSAKTTPVSPALQRVHAAKTKNTPATWICDDPQAKCVEFTHENSVVRRIKYSDQDFEDKVNKALNLLGL